MPVGSELLVSKGLPSPLPDATLLPPRGNIYREQFIVNMLNSHHGLGAEGSLFCTANTTPGTPISYAIQASFSDTVAAFTFRNADTNTLYGKNIGLLAIRMLMGTTVPASATAAHYAIKVDNVVRGSAGTVLTPVSPLSQQNGLADVRYTPTVAAASSNAKLIDRGIIRSVIPVVNDEYIFLFGSNEWSGGISDIAGTTAKRIIIPCPAVQLAPGGNNTMLLHIWFPGNAATAGQFEFSTVHYER